MTEKQTINYLKAENNAKDNLIKKLIKYYNLSQNNLSDMRFDHTPNWQNLQNIADDIEDDHDLSIYE